MSADERTEAGVSEEAVEAAAQAIYEAEWDGPFDATSEVERAMARQIATACLKVLVDGGHYVLRENGNTGLGLLCDALRAERDSAVARAEAAERALGEVAKLHRCADSYGGTAYCNEDGFTWPCLTARTLAQYAPDAQAREETK